MMIKQAQTIGLTAILLSLAGCVIAPATPKDISVYKANMPKSILVLPPVNDTPDVKATYSYWPTVMQPVAEAGYYVFPLSVVDTMFKENGITNANDAQNISHDKLKEIFGADSALYIRIKQYGSKYQVLQTSVSVAVDAKLVDLKTGQTLWTGEKELVQANNNSNNGIAGILVGALVDQIVNNLSDKAYPLSGMVSQQLLTPTYTPGVGLLYGPRSPKFQQDGIVK